MKEGGKQEPIGEKVGKAVMARTVFGLGLMLAFSLRASDWPDTIVNGQETNYSSYKGVVALIGQISTSTTKVSLCTATFIAADVLLTAGHCVYNREENDASSPIILDGVSKPNTLMVLNGANIANAYFVLAYVDKVIKHPNWNGYLNTSGDKDDIALVKLDRKINSLEIYDLRQQPQESVGESGVIVGYGSDGSSSDTAAGIHRWGNVSITQSLEKELAAGNPSGACYGDSGGPLFSLQNGHYVVSGVASFVVGDCSATNGGHYMSVLGYMSFITETLQTLLCGDGVVDAGEICDGESRTCNNFGDYPSWIWAPCQSDCMGFDTTYCWDAAKAECGNGIQEGLEECDDGNSYDGDDCSNECKNAYCGDGVQNSGEACDYADPSFSDYYGDYYTCTMDCQLLPKEQSSDGKGGCSLIQIAF